MLFILIGITFLFKIEIMENVYVNQILWTRDGREVGNAIVIEILESGSVRIKTDYGNIVRLTEVEVDELFYWTKEGVSKEQMKYIQTTHKHAVLTHPQKTQQHETKRN